MTSGPWGIERPLAQCEFRIIYPFMLSPIDSYSASMFDASVRRRSITEDAYADLLTREEEKLVNRAVKDRNIEDGVAINIESITMPAEWLGMDDIGNDTEPTPRGKPVRDVLNDVADKRGRSDLRVDEPIVSHTTGGLAGGARPFLKCNVDIIVENMRDSTVTMDDIEKINDSLSDKNVYVGRVHKIGDTESKSMSKLWGSKRKSFERDIIHYDGVVVDTNRESIHTETVRDIVRSCSSGIDVGRVAFILR